VSFNTASRLLSVKSYDITKSISPDTFEERASNLVVYAMLGDSFPTIEVKSTFKLFVRYHCWNNTINGVRLFASNSSNLINST